MNHGGFSPDVQEFLRLLSAHAVRYVIVGGEAVIYHGHARLTGDVDVFFDQEPANTQRLFEALLEFWAGAVPGLGSAAELSVPGVIVMFGRPPNRLDLLGRIDGVTFEEVWAGRVETELEVGGTRVPVPYIGLEALLKNKRAAGRPKDLDDLPFLEAARSRRK